MECNHYVNNCIVFIGVFTYDLQWLITSRSSTYFSDVQFYSIHYLT